MTQEIFNKVMNGKKLSKEETKVFYNEMDKASKFIKDVDEFLEELRAEVDKIKSEGEKNVQTNTTRH